MAETFVWTKFSACNLDDPFFDSLKKAYAEFPVWFKKKADAGEEALVARDDRGILAFVYLKAENEPITLRDRELPAIGRLKIGTFKMAERYQHQRAGEGAMGVALWHWQELRCEEIYATMFHEQESLISLFERFGFHNVGLNERGEQVYLRSRKHIDYSNPYASFPFICPNFTKAGIVPVEQDYHDRLFPYSELKGTQVELEQEAAGNGMTKVFIGFPYQMPSYTVGEPVFIYRKSEDTPKWYHSCITSFATITRIDVIKNNGSPIVDCATFVRKAGNKTLFSAEELAGFHRTKPNIVMLEMVYNGVFGKGHNVPYGQLKQAALFERHPYGIEYSKEQFVEILKMGDKDAKNIIVD